MKRHSQQTKDKALELWKSGTKLEDIHKQLDIPIETLRTWHERYQWSEKRKNQKKKNEQELSKKIAKQDAKEKFDARQEMINETEFLQVIQSDTVNLVEPQKPIEQLMLRNVLINASKARQSAIFSIAKIDGLIVDKSKHEGEITHTVIPIFGSDIKANVPSHDSNQKDN